MPRNRLLYLVLLLALLAGSIFSPAPVTARAHQGAGPGAVVAWNSIAVRAIVSPSPVGAGQPPAHALITLGYVQAAVYNAVVAIEGVYAPYHSHLGRQPGASVDAAVAAAAHDVLLHYLPGQQAALDSDYAAALAALPAGPATEAGLQLGQAAAAEIIALRQNDGLLASVSYPPKTGPGAWILPPPALPLTPWVAKMRPFLIRQPFQFRPGPPPPLTSQRWARDYNEVLTVGRSNSLTRTPEQTDAAKFWTDNPARQNNLAFALLIQARGFNALQAARLYAMGNLVTADAAIACWDAKYHYQFWRPGPAIVAGDTDGNPNTIADPTWTGLFGMPPHPEYPSGHGCVTSALAEVFTEILGTKQIEVDMPTTVAGVTQTTRHFATANDLRQEIIDVRVWSGIHYRNSDEVGVAVGLAVARWGVRRYFQPQDR